MPDREVPKTLEAALRSEQELLAAVVRSHYAIDSTLEEFLHLALPLAKQIELERVAFLLKADFLIALGFIPAQSRSLFEQINGIRNKFAHNPDYAPTKKEYAAAKAAVSASFPGIAKTRLQGEEKFSSVLYWLTLGAWVLLTRARESVERNMAESYVVNEEMDAVLSSLPERQRSTEELVEYENRVQHAVQRIRKSKSRSA